MLKFDKTNESYSLSTKKKTTFYCENYNYMYLNLIKIKVMKVTICNIFDLHPSDVFSTSGFKNATMNQLTYRFFGDEWIALD